MATHWCDETIDRLRATKIGKGEEVRYRECGSGVWVVTV